MTVHHRTHLSRARRWTLRSLLTWMDMAGGPCSSCSARGKRPDARRGLLFFALPLLATAASALVSSHAARTRELWRVWRLSALLVELAGECMGNAAAAALRCIGVSAVVGSVLLNSVACGAPKRTLARWTLAR